MASPLFPPLRDVIVCQPAGSTSAGTRTTAAGDPWADREKDLRLSAAEGIDAVMTEHHLDAILFPGGSGAAIAAKPGYPTVMVPFGFVPNVPFAGGSTPPPAFPAAFDPKPAPYGVSFTGMACSEPRLLELAYAFEQATKRRVPPPSVP
jgi:amidase